MRNARYLIIAGGSLVLILISFPARGHAATFSDVINTLRNALIDAHRMFSPQEGARFHSGDRVTAPATSDIRTDPEFSFWLRVGRVPAGTRGTIIGSPRTVGGTVWWKVLYDNGVFGWIRESSLTAAPQGVGLVGPQTSVAEGTPGVPDAAGTPGSSQSGYGPTLISINPSSLLALQPVTFTITGSNLQQGAVIVYSGPSSGTIATEFESSTRLRVSVPGGLLAGSYSARVRNPDGRESGSATVTATSAQTDPNTLVSAKLVDVEIKKRPWPRGLGDDDPAWTFYINPQEGDFYFWTFARILAPVDPSFPGQGGYRTVSWKEVPRIRINFMNWLTYRRTAVYQSPDGELNGAASGPLQPPGVGVTLANAAPAIFYSQNSDAEFEKYLDEVKDYVLTRAFELESITYNFKTAAGTDIPIKLSLDDTRNDSFDVTWNAAIVGGEYMRISSSAQTAVIKLPDGSTKVTVSVPSQYGGTNVTTLMITPDHRLYYEVVGKIFSGETITIKVVQNPDKTTSFIFSDGRGTYRETIIMIDQLVALPAISSESFIQALDAVLQTGRDAAAILLAERIHRLYLFAVSFAPFGIGTTATAIQAAYMIDDALQTLGFRTSSQMIRELSLQLAQAGEYGLDPDILLGTMVTETEAALASGRILSDSEAIIARNVLNATVFRYVDDTGVSYYVGEQRAGSPTDGNFGGTPNFSLIYSGPDANVQAP